MVIQPRNKGRSDLLKKFDEGATVTSLAQEHPKNTVYRWYKIWLLLKIKNEIDARLVTQDLKPLSQRDCEKVLKFVRTGLIS